MNTKNIHKVSGMIWTHDLLIMSRTADLLFDWFEFDQTS